MAPRMGSVDALPGNVPCARQFAHITRDRERDEAVADAENTGTSRYIQTDAASLRVAARRYRVTLRRMGNHWTPEIRDVGPRAAYFNRWAAPRPDETPVKEPPGNKPPPEKDPPSKKAPVKEPKKFAGRCLTRDRRPKRRFQARVACCGPRALGVWTSPLAFDTPNTGAHVDHSALIEAVARAKRGPIVSDRHIGATS